MTTITNTGLNWIRDVALGRVDEEIDAIAVGSGTGNEGTGAAALASEEYRAEKSNEDVVFVETDTGAFEAVITVTGDQEVAAGTAISEIAVFGGEGVGDADLLVIDEFADVTVEQGHTEEFTVPIDITR